jgi:MFS family permease
MRPLHYYLVGTGTWFMAFGVQGVMFAWLVTMVLNESPERVGIAQMSLLLPGTLLLLVGGSYADRFGGRRMAMLAQGLACLAPLILIGVLAADRLTYATMLGYAVLMGVAQAFVTPARDGLLNRVAEGRVQRAVMLTSMIQFGLQVVGFIVASQADRFGPQIILGVQALVLAIGILAFGRVQVANPSRTGKPQRLMNSLLEGARSVFSSAPMRLIVAQNIAMAMFFMGSYIVTMPLLVREVYQGSASDLALMNGFNSLGLVTSIVLLLRLGDVHRQGRALILSQVFGGMMLCVAAFSPAFPGFVAALFFWGLCGGVAMTMARTIMQEHAPTGQLSRIMSFYALSFMGAGPIGALLNGFLVEQVGPQMALLFCGSAMILTMAVVGALSGLWRLDSRNLVPGAVA